jgi:hypothetical protein
MMMRTVLSLSLLFASFSIALATDLPTSQAESEFAMLVRNHGFVAPALPQETGEATAEAIVEDVIVESEIAAIAEGDETESAIEEGFEAPIVNQQHHNVGSQRRVQRGGVLSELERRKNAWLKKTFFGR